MRKRRGSYSASTSGLYHRPLSSSASEGQPSAVAGGIKARASEANEEEGSDDGDDVWEIAADASAIAAALPMPSRFPERAVLGRAAKCAAEAGAPPPDFPQKISRKSEGPLCTLLWAPRRYKKAMSAANGGRASNLARDM